MLTYKADLVGIQVRTTEESYTSKASFLDADPLPIYDPTQPAPTFSVDGESSAGCTGRQMAGTSTPTPTAPTTLFAK
jgi:hypothetical protein